MLNVSCHTNTPFWSNEVNDISLYLSYLEDFLDIIFVQKEEISFILYIIYSIGLAYANKQRYCFFKLDIAHTYPTNRYW